MLLPLGGCARPPARWVEATVAEQPSARNLCGTALDTKRGRLVLFGGALATEELAEDTWEFDGREWTAVDEGTGPTARTRCAMVYDAARAETLVFGGYDDTEALGGMWGWNGTEWRYVEEAEDGPSPRLGASMAYDSRRERVVLFGGSDVAGLLGDTWEWDGVEWIAIDVEGPRARYGHAMVYDPVRGVIVLFGGAAARTWEDHPDFRPELAETWEYNGQTWTRFRGRTPPPRLLHGLVWDAGRKSVILYGGIDGRVPLTDVWEYNGIRWAALRVEGPAPEPRQGFAFAMAPGGGPLLFGGSTTRFHGDAWRLHLPSKQAAGSGTGDAEPGLRNGNARQPGVAGR